MKPSTIAAPQRPSERSLGVVDGTASRIRPDDPALEDWTSNYLREHRLRLATDVDLVTEHVSAGARVLDVGAAPFVATGALAALECDVLAVDLRPERFASAIDELRLDVRRCNIESERSP